MPSSDQLKKALLDTLFRPVDMKREQLEPDTIFRLGDSESLFRADRNGAPQQGDPAIYIYHDAVFWPAESVVQRAGEIGRHTYLDEARREQLRNMSSLRRYPVVKHEGWATSIECIYPTTNYYHFFVDALPRVWALRHPQLRHLPITLFYTRTLDKEREHILRGMLPPNVTLRKTFRFSRVAATHYIHLPYLSKDRVQYGDTLTPTSAGYIPNEYLDAFRTYVFDRYGITPPSTPTRKLYITRRHASQRRVLNDDEVSALLQRHGFEVVALEKRSLAEQAELFASASIIVAQHGAGLTNLLYMQKGGALVEIFSSPHFYRYYAQYAESAGIHYEHVHLGRGWKEADITMPIDLLESVVQRVPWTESAET